ncbi:5'/3'-nucleotidase SurE [Parvicella tangerina]|uniref:5'-nucleotidase SurE n=1 Tax=Parvicella tangerina TaxID=2829795 RepID=A0A916JQ32_9FLAO|nr:5'/3'-nucleotidase SurE [Parvicella tangerina]CAG5083962.1 5'-nucleotidase SurE [Parvicella tangerina]
MEKKPLILVTNDDGFTAPGIKALIEVVGEFAELLIIAPDKPQSGMGHAITVNAPLRMYETDYFGKHRAYYSSGTPVDCVKLGMYVLGDRRPDLIVSGVNHGSNVSTNVLYSGTMSAAVEGALEGLPSIGFSLCDHDWAADFEPAKVYIKKIVENTLKNGLEKGVCLNVNIPKLPLDAIKGVRVCRQARAYWDDTFDERIDPLKKKYYWLTGSFHNHDKGREADMVALDEGFITIVPTQYDMTAHHAIGDLNEWDL